MSMIYVQVIVGKRVINFTLEDVQEMEVREFPGIQRATEVTIKCKKITNEPRIRNR